MSTKSEPLLPAVPEYEELCLDSITVVSTPARPNRKHDPASARHQKLAAMKAEIVLLEEEQEKAINEITRLAGLVQSVLLQTELPLEQRAQEAAHISEELESAKRTLARARQKCSRKHSERDLLLTWCSRASENAKRMERALKRLSLRRASSVSGDSLAPASAQTAEGPSEKTSETKEGFATGHALQLKVEEDKKAQEASAAAKDRLAMWLSELPEATSSSDQA